MVEDQRLGTRLTGIALVVAAPALVFVFPTLTLLASNRRYFDSLLGSGSVLFAAAFLWVAIASALYRFRHRSAARRTLIAHALIAPAWVSYEVARAATGGDMAIGVGALVAVVGGAELLARRPLRRMLEHLGFAAAILLLGYGALTVWELTAEADAEQDADADAEAEAAEEAERASMPPPDRPIPPDELDADKPVVYHLVFDEFQTDAFDILLDDQTRAALDGFTYYPEALTSWGRTTMSLASMFSTRAYDYEQSPLRYVEQSYLSDRSTLRILREQGYHITGFLHRQSIVGGPEPYDRVYHHIDFVDEGAFGGEQARLAVSLWAYKSLPGRIAERVLPFRHWAQLSGQGLLPDTEPPVSMQGFREFLAAEPVQEAHGRYVFVHLIHPHFPHVLDEGCGYVPGRTTGPLAQSACAVRAMVDFIDLLRDLDRFEDAAIVIHSDHGGRYERRGDDLVNIQGRGLYSEDFSFARARSLLLFKPPGTSSTGGQVAVSSRHAVVDDIMPTLFDVLDIPTEFSEDRTSLLASRFPERAVRKYHFYESKDPMVVDGGLTRYEIDGETAREERRILPAVADVRYRLSVDGSTLKSATGEEIRVTNGPVSGVVEDAEVKGDEVVIRGLAADVEAGGLADFIVVMVDDRSVYVGMEDLDRWDRVHRFDSFGLRRSGFEASIPRASLGGTSPSELSVFAVRDGRATLLENKQD